MGKTEIAFFFSDFQCYWILELALMLPTPHNMLAFGAKKIDRKLGSHSRENYEDLQLN